MGANPGSGVPTLTAATPVERVARAYAGAVAHADFGATHPALTARQSLGRVLFDAAQRVPAYQPFDCV